MKLISMVDYVLHESKSVNHPKTVNKIISYANFLKQPLELLMFVPCDEDGNVLEEPIFPFRNDNDYQCTVIYNQAKERCLFEDCIYDEEMKVIRKDYGIDLFYIPKHELFTIETMTNYDLTLTQTAIKQIS